MKRIATWTLINILPIILIWYHIDDLYRVFYTKTEDYPFGSAFFAPFSIYQSKTVYVTFSLVTIVALTGLLYSSFKQNWKWYFIILVINLILFTYPMLTNE